MKKVININFQGRVIPIEESAYELLKTYVESLRNYFAKEEGRDEIINDIEGRIAELFSERLKKGVTCITDADVEAIIASMGRPADLEAAEMESGSFKTEAPKNTATASYDFRPQGGLFRNADDKLIGGVCSGLANYLRIDPVIVRIIFLILIGAIFWVYILLWIVIPSKSIQTNITKRLYRSADQKVFAGVCGGLSAYFSVDVKVVRLIFALPLVFALFFSGPFHFFTHSWDFMPGFRFAGGSLTGSLLLAYIILWIAVPVASTAAEKLEMKGEKIDLNSISSKVKEDLETLKGKAEQFGEEVKNSAKDLGQRAKNAGSEAAPIARKAGFGVLSVIAVLIKIFAFFIMGIIAITLFSVLIGLLFGGYALLPLKDFFLDNPTEQFLIWATLILFLGVPIVGIITWIVRRIIGVKSGKHYLGWIFGLLWTAGWVSLIWLAVSVTSNFKVRASSKISIPLIQPNASKLVVDVMEGENHISDLDYFDEDWNKDWPIYGLNQDTFLLKTIRVNVVKSNDDQFHVEKVNLGRGENLQAARIVAEKITFDIQQKDSLLLLPADFSISKTEKFRNQQVVVIVSVPLHKRLVLKRRLDDYQWFNIRTNSGIRGINIEIDHDLFYEVPAGNEYIMTDEFGLINIKELDPTLLQKGLYKKLDESPEEEQPVQELPAPKKPTAPDSPTYEYKDRKGIRTSSLTGMIPSFLPVL